MSKCERCEELIAIAGRGRIPKFCSTRCRVAAHRAIHKTSVPIMLRALPRWVRWVEVERAGKKTKMPLTTHARMASSTNPLTWAAYKDAHASSVGNGFGFVLNGDGIMCIDLDHCVEDGIPNQLALDFMATLPKTYIEFSPSKTGLHIWGFGSVDRGTRKFENGLHVETYSTGRYMTVTGEPFIAAPLAQLV